MACLPDYAELHCLSNFSFLRGASHPEELVERAGELGYRALAITDEASFAGAVRAHAQAEHAKFKLIIGTELRLDDGLRLVLLATDRGAYGAISALISRGRRRAAKGAYSLSRVDIEACADKGMLALLLAPQGAEQATWLADRFAGRAWIAAELLLGPNDYALLRSLREIGARSGLPLVAAGDVHMHRRSRRPLQDTLAAIRLGKTVAQCGLDLHPNGERHLRLRARLAQIYPSELLAETVAIAERCGFSLGELRYEYPEEIVPPGHTASTWLRHLTEQGLARRFPAGVPPQVLAQVESELALIAELRYEAFFLTVEDIVRYARSQNILCQGRGSAANSVVCYALGITEVNPDRLDMLFGRFLSKERDEPPDIDVDFEHERREEVIQYVYAKYGRERAALAATVITYRPRSALRDVAKALGPDAGHLAVLAAELLGFPRHLSQHVGGFVIARGPLAELVPIENAAMLGRTVIQWDKEDLESLGLLKVDVLALGMLSAIHRALRWLDMAGMEAVPKEDPAVYAMLQKADTIGVFQVESRAQMSMLPRLKPENYYDLVVQVAIVRPGPIKGGMVHPYLRRRAGLEKIEYHKDEMRNILERTLGIPIFQEQVMQLSMVAAGFTAGEADQLRRSMGSWERNGSLHRFERKLKDGMRESGYPSEFADRIYEQIKGFGEYGFPESHAASFALLAYISAWIKCHHPAVFCAALLNSQPMGFYGPSQLVQDAQRHGAEVRPADVGISDWDCTLEGGALRLGLRMIGGLSQAAAKRILAVRPAVSIADLARRADLNQKDLRCLAAAGALRGLAGHRRNAHWLAAGAENRPALGVPAEEPPPQLAPPTEGQNITADYASLGLTLERHPLALLRSRLDRLGLVTAQELHLRAHGSRVSAAGLVTCRQRPATKTGVVFVTLEDETGCVNVVVWNDLFERQRRELVDARLLAVEGTVESDGKVVHLVARRLVDRSALLGPLRVRSHDFH